VLHWAAISGGAKDSIIRYLLLNGDSLITDTDEVRLLTSLMSHYLSPSFRKSSIFCC